MGTLSFNGNKTVTTGGGGAILTNDARAGTAREASDHHGQGAAPWEYRHDELGYNYRLPNLNAALGLRAARAVAAAARGEAPTVRALCAGVCEHPGVRLHAAEPPGCRSNYWLQTLLLDASCAASAMHFWRRATTLVSRPDPSGR